VGCDVHITRKQHWSNDEGPGISLEEWTEVVRTDPEMRLDGSAEVTTPAGDVIRYENQGLAVWTAYSGRGGRTPWFDYRRGRIVVKNPDERMLKKMGDLAQPLSARVEGDEGEIYDSRGKVAS
jgi:hypothetical protein